MNETVHIVSIISPTHGINNKVFKDIEEALMCYSYYYDAPKDEYATSKTSVYLQQNVEIK